jgi:dihydrolipoamide dehydrogenase
MFDLIIIGGGPAGYFAAELAGKSGMNVCLIEKNRLGGVCLNEGCIPSKTLLNSSKLLSQARHSEQFGVKASDVVFDFGRVMSRKNFVVDALRNGIIFTLKKTGVTVESGTALIKGKNVDSFDVDINGKTVCGKRLLLCTGAEAIRLPVKGADLPFVLTNREVLSIDRIPENIVVIGAGAIGLELAVFFTETGSKVSVVEKLPYIGGNIDEDIGRILRRELEKAGMTFFTETGVTGIGDHVVDYSSSSGSGQLKADIVLMSVGRRPNIKGLGIESIGVGTERSAVVTDTRGRTNVQGVWAAGDINGKSMLAHTAYREAAVCIDDMLGKVSSVNYDAIPGVMYTHPETAVVGLTQKEAEIRGIEVAVSKLPMSYNGRYIAENENGRGVCKVVADKKSGVIVGVHIIGSACSEMIFGAAAIIEKRLTVSDLSSVVFPHPSVSEIIKDAAMKINIYD